MSCFYKELCDTENCRVQRAALTSEMAGKVPSPGGLRGTQYASKVGSMEMVKTGQHSQWEKHSFAVAFEHHFGGLGSLS